MINDLDLIVEKFEVGQVGWQTLKKEGKRRGDEESSQSEGGIAPPRSKGRKVFVDHLFSFLCEMIFVING